jgi:methylated-DNA-[protein]-cysteine S-methyltransferase
MAKSIFETPLGRVVAVADDKGICSLDFDEVVPLLHEENRHLIQLEKELLEYFIGERKTFDVCLNPHGTPFQRAAWRILCDIPYGSVISYTQEAQMLSHPKAVRAVANANGKNPIPIIIPCHRVIAKGGGIGGYSGGIWRKEFMLELERNNR